jgi:hypothetical protein
MPVTARLSRTFYERLGNDAATELVNWFNQVDETNRAQLRELNELNFARFDAKMEQRLAELRAELFAEIATLRVEFRTALSEQKAELMRWMFGLWATQMVTMVGMFLGVWFKHG